MADKSSPSPVLNASASKAAVTTDASHSTEVDERIQCEPNPATLGKGTQQGVSHSSFDFGPGTGKSRQPTPNIDPSIDLTEWLFKEQAKLTAEFQRRQMAQQKTARVLSYGSPGHGNNRQNDAPPQDGRSGGRGRNTHGQDYAIPERQHDGYDSQEDDQEYHPSHQGTSNATSAHRKYNVDDDLTRPYRPRAFAERSKFVERVATAELPGKTKLPSTIGKYDGIADPDDFLHSFDATGNALNWSMPVWCHMFVQCLTGAARVWFDNLPTGSVKNYDDLEQKFKAHFS